MPRSQLHDEKQTRRQANWLRQAPAATENAPDLDVIKATEVETLIFFLSVKVKIQNTGVARILC